MVTVPQTESNLLSYFQTGDTPTQDQWEELIRTFFYLFNQSNDKADEAIETAESAVTTATNLSPKFLASFGTVSVGVTPPAIVDGNAYISGALTQTNTTPNPTIRINFTTPFANANYKVCTPSWSVVVTRNTNYVEVQNPPGKTFFLVIFK